MDSTDEWTAFLEKVKRTIYVDNLSPQVTESVLKAAFNQFGIVISVQFIPNYTFPEIMPQSALVEMENAKQADEILEGMATCPLMICGMPRPVRSRPAILEMFADRPRKPGRRIRCCWLDSQDPNFQVAKKIRYLVRNHAVAASFMLECQLSNEKKLANQQAETLEGNCKKFELIDAVRGGDGVVRRLAHHYNVPLSDA